MDLNETYDVTTLEHDAVRDRLTSHNLHGRRQIFTGEAVITDANVIDVLETSLATHRLNRGEEIFLYDYMRGIQPILYRTKKYNAEINNKIVINLANQIVNFKASEFAGEPIQYVSRASRFADGNGRNTGRVGKALRNVVQRFFGSSDKTIPDKVSQLNSMMMTEGKQSKDFEMAKKMFCGGVGYRLTIHDQSRSGADIVARNNVSDYLDEAPFEIYVPDPWNTFVVRYNDVSKRVVMGVTYVFKNPPEGEPEYTVYTPNVTYTIANGDDGLKIVNRVQHNFGMISLVEYPCNPERMGAFEVVIDLLDAYNLAASDRQDAIDAFVQALMVFDGIDVEEGDIAKMKALGAVKLPPAQSNVGGGGRRLYYLNEQLDQSQTQTFVNDMYKTILQIVGMPAQGDGNNSDSSNNGAIIMKNGWWHAEARMLETQDMWKASEAEFLKIVLKICAEANVLTGLKVSDLEPKFWRQSYEDLLVKTQSFSTLRSAGMPAIQAFTYSHLSKDPESDAIIYDAYQEELAQRLDENNGILTEENLRDEEIATREELTDEAAAGEESSGSNEMYAICPICGKRFKKSYPGQQYNSIACANRARRSRSGIARGT